MLTLTTRHSRKDDSEALLGAIAQAEQRLKRLKCWAALPVAGYARVLEWTYGNNGHHPHYHTIILMKARTSRGREGGEGPSTVYMAQLAKAGRDGMTSAAWRHSFQVQGAAAAPVSHEMGAAEELTGAQHKAGHGLTQWQLLRLARKAQPENGQTAAQVRAFYAARWWEVMKAVKGRSQLFKSEGFKALAAEYLDANPEDAAPEPETVLSFGTREKGRRTDSVVVSRGSVAAGRQGSGGADPGPRHCVRGRPGRPV